MKNSDYTFNIGDVVVTTEGETGMIVDICKCERCRDRGWYEPMWCNDDTGEIDYITNYQAESGFVGFHRIGKYNFGDFEKSRISDKILKLKDELESLEKRLELIKDLEASEKDRVGESTKEYKKVIHAHWEPLKVYPDEYCCSNCGVLWNDEKTPYCHDCGAIMDEHTGDKKD